ncbi:MAG: NUDIX domain-containing protein [Gammaproteobacteria bacterium]|nr:NUDIX domain-containing protein [Gammaproteobacteria bacterium]
MNAEDVEVLGNEVLSDDFVRLTRYQLRHRRFDGSRSDSLSREVIDRGPVVAVLPVDLARREIVLVEQFRPGAYFAGESAPWLIECIAGLVEPKESTTEVAKREAFEEAGCVLEEVHFVMRVLSSPGASTECADLFWAPMSTVGVGGVHGLAAEGEDIRVHVVSVDEAFSWLKSGRIINAKAVILLQWLEATIDRLASK